MTIILPDNRKPSNSKPQPPAGVLRKPSDADAFRVDVGQWGERWYCDNLPACDLAPATTDVWPSVSTVKKAVPFRAADVVAIKRIVEARHTINLDVEPGTLTDQLTSINKRGLGAASDRGTHVHTMAEQMLYGLPVDKNGPGAAYYPALAEFFDAYQPELVAAEFVCIHRDLNGKGHGGTSDGAIRIQGDIAAIDWKSRGEETKHAAYPEEAAQLGAYAGSQYILVEGDDGMAGRAPVPAFNLGLIISIKPDGARLYPIDLDKAWEHYQKLHAWWVAGLTARDAIGRVWPIKRKAVAVDPGRGPVADGGVEAVAAASASPADPFDGLVTQNETPSLARRAPKPKPAYSDDDLIDDGTYDAFQKAFKAMTLEQAVEVKRVAGQANDAGHSVSVAQRRSVRRFNIGTALIAWAVAGRTEDDLRASLYLATGHEDVLQPATPVGAAVGVLGNEQAARFAQIVAALVDGNTVPDPATGAAVRWAA